MYIYIYNIFYNDLLSSASFHVEYNMYIDLIIRDLRFSCLPALLTGAFYLQN